MPAPAIETQRVLVVDMDGTLLATDTLWEAIILLVKTRPSSALLLPFWLLGGKASFKRQVTERVSLDPATLPYRDDVLSYLRNERVLGRQIVLATASYHSVAESVAAHVGVFSAVLATRDGATNLSGARKLAAIREHAGDLGFDYIGDSAVDHPIWRAAHEAMLVAPSEGLLRAARSGASVTRVFAPRRSLGPALLRALRVHQWIKNLLLFVPVAMAHRVADVGAMRIVVIAFFAFSLCASAVYVLNDLFDLDADRHHPQKRLRPFAAGSIPIQFGVAAIPGLLSAAIALGLLVPNRLFLAELGIYFAITTAYTFWLKRIVIIDVLTLAGLYTMRILAGGAAAEVPVSEWLLAFSTFLFLSLAILKRFAELRMALDRKLADVKGRDYALEDIELLRSVGPASGYLSVLVLALYVSSSQVVELYRTPAALWMICPPLLYWITRMWLLASRGRINGDPIVFAVKDPASYAVGAAVLVTLITASTL